MKRILSTLCCLFTFIALLGVTSVSAEEPVDWNRFRGPNGTGIAHDVKIPNSWNEDAYEWRIELPGRGVSSPVVWRMNGEERVFVQGGLDSDDGRYLRCVNGATGELVWEKTQKYSKPRLHTRNSFGSSTPAVDESGVYSVFGDGKQFRLTKYDHDGKEVWNQELGPFLCNHGGAFSPVLINDMVICSLQQPQGDTVATVLHTFDRKSGEAGWKTTMTAHAKASFSAPCLRETSDGKTEIVCVSTGSGLFAVDPDSGEKKWSLPVFTMRTVSSPVLAGDVVLGSTGSGGGGNYVVAVRPNGDEVEEAYRVTKQAPYVPTPIYRDGLVFLWSDKGIGTCIDAKTGDELWKERVSKETGASPICIGNRIIGVTEGGEVAVISASRHFQKMGVGSLGEVSQSTPAVGANRVYFRSDTHLMALGAK